VTDSAFYDVMAISKAPAIASHSSARHFTPGFERNMNDDMIKALAENGGVIQINFGSSFVTEESNKAGFQGYMEMLKYLEENDIEQGSEEAEAYMITLSTSRVSIMWVSALTTMEWATRSLLA
jgi:membrane dipeptidase